MTSRLMPAVCAASFLCTSFCTGLLAQDFRDINRSNLAPDSGADIADVAVGDLDGDGDPDLVLAAFGAPGNGDRNFWLRNDGTGLFDPTPTGSLQLAPSLSRAVVLGDFDGDGDLDAFFGNQTIDAVCRNDGSGQLALSIGDLPELVRETFAARAVDIDGDNDLDIVCAAGGFDIIYRNDGSGVFSDASSLLPATWNETRDLDIGDYDGDGDLDIVQANADVSSRLLLNDGSGSFATTTQLFPRAIAVSGGDVDGDGDRDFVVLRQEWAFPIGFFYETFLERNDGAGSFSQEQLTSPSEFTPHIPKLVDVDGDGDLDLVRAGIGVLRNDSTGSFTETPAQPWLGSNFADIDGDGDPDMVGEPTLRNDGTGRFLLPSGGAVPAIDQGQAVALTDFDQDGDRDLVIRADTTIRILSNNGRGEFRGLLAAIAINSWDGRSWLTADWTGDGFPDLMPISGSVYYENVSGTGLVARNLPAGMPNKVPLDADGDGDLDLVATQPNATAAWFRNLNGTFSAAIPTGLGTLNNLLASADFDGDTRLDLLYRTSAGQLVWARCTGDGQFAAMTGAIPDGLPGGFGAAATDLDNDGDTDIVLGHDFSAGSGGQVTVLENQGGGQFVVATSLLPAYQTIDAIVQLDADGDGDTDLLAQTRVFGTGQSRLLRNDGGFAFVDITDASQPWRGLPIRDRAIVLADDIDRDGDTDIILGQDTETILLSNLQRQLLQREAPTIGTSWQLDITQRPVGTSFGSIALGLAELDPGAPTPFGTLRVDPSGAVLTSLVAILDYAPTAAYTLPIPNDPTLVGMELFAQHIELAAAGIALGNQLRGEVGSN